MALIRALQDGDAGNIEEVKLLIKGGADVNYRVYGYGWNSLFWAVNRGQFDMCMLLLDHGVDVNNESNNGWTPLMLAVYQSGIDIIKLLLIRGANVNHINKIGHTILSYALNRPKILSILRWRGIRGYHHTNIDVLLFLIYSEILPRDLLREIHTKWLS
jgi:ankyrin repeat protein